jgi:hypothetical protein
MLPSRRPPPPWGALEHRSPVAVEDRIYNCYSGNELIDEGLERQPRAAAVRERLERRQANAPR